MLTLSIIVFTGRGSGGRYCSDLSGEGVSTQECSYQAPSMRLNAREWRCQNCHTHHERDINASEKTLSEGLRL